MASPERLRWPALLIAALVFCCGLKHLSAQKDASKVRSEFLQAQKNMALALSSTSFAESSKIPGKFTCEAEDLSPELSWSGTPSNTASFALLADDPDAPSGTWTHWVLFDLPANSTNLPEGLEKKESLPNGARQGRNDFGKTGYNGPCPPPGKPHRYYFKLYALDRQLELKGGATRGEVEKALQGHVLATAQWMGRYQR
jgi:Raf kinase inhibitor-like YbhB/YbcL family protein